MPQARSSGSGASSGGSSSGRSSSRRSSGTRSSSSRSSGTTRRTTRSSSSSGSGTRSRARASSGGAGRAASGGATHGAAAAGDQRLDAVAQRVRKLNEKIIEESKTAGEATLTAYEKALKAIASSLERGPGKSDVEWISSLATTQAKWIRDVTAAWTSAARGMLK
jgi:hypothetical protein